MTVKDIEKLAYKIGNRQQAHLNVLSIRNGVLNALSNIIVPEDTLDHIYAIVKQIDDMIDEHWEKYKDSVEPFKTTTTELFAYVPLVIGARRKVSKKTEALIAKKGTTEL